ncbi:BlaI/MecI/CopY family transcriptional regulator [Lishizhenia sp.]|uniref:BlaI/MecI/CopY family transcriptional regulator n=1 Tax=Lishizhenia sp. TaxID=2497594 RepID=UPI00299D8A4D|nr:BlaI/MecI/CopY family transcriptional regulator [Lishizhenia sp.]MDX1444563.1 BlaI/MecI/CopY family transcriptional regulator [Lishizhenia sp.]
MQRLTPAEEKVMLKLWRLEVAVVKDILELYEKPRPSYNTVSTIVRILEKKKFIEHKKKGRGYIYMPRVTQSDYSEYLISFLKANYFDNDVEKFKAAIV